MRRIILFCILSLQVCMAVWGQSYQDWCDRALTAIENDSLSQAEFYLKQALKVDPANPHNALLFSNLGTIQRQMKQEEQALESYTLALNLAPKAVPILLNRATLYMEMGRNDAARVDYSLVLDLDKDNKEALLMRAYIYMQACDYKSAEADYQHLLKIVPSDFNARLGLATLKQKQAKFLDALSLLNEMITEQAVENEDKLRLAILYVARAGVEKDLTQNDAALADLNDAIRLNASCAEAYLIRGQIYLLQEKKEQAKQDFERAMSLGVSPTDLRELIQACD